MHIECGKELNPPVAQGNGRNFSILRNMLPLLYLLAQEWISDEVG
jgi:hypothetical protein